ncbi:dipeptide epimerase [Gloeocapsa sp. PCC 73106]|uniref:dipeptide epimerase n=1 Tax=Gloeocapsa sp. PCC 73106 TaxID=102232 RepID=UPI0002ACABBC|nr:dipeptide epimerase [Gloeocapsa sp. PCC 73106]ELR97011.1 enolase superfamily enzyme [Gloeocapsa sp. PCC 73106]
MQISFDSFTVHKRFPLTISRGTTSQTTNFWIRIEAEGVEGWGEASNCGDISEEVAEISPQLEIFQPWERQKISEFLAEVPISTSFKAALDVALYDWLGKKVGLPLWRLWGLDFSRIVPISVTIGINTPDIAQQRVQDWGKIIDIQLLKVKLGNPEGIAADQEMLLAIRKIVPQIPLTVDANGGWSLSDAIAMCQWLAPLGVKYVEQPLAVGEESNLFQLRQASPLPIFVDESCNDSCDLLRLASDIDGVNLKLMKAGSLSEIMGMIQIARALDKQIMYGCYSDSSLANTAMSHLSPLADYLDLDSHLNLVDDPFVGAKVTAGKLLPPDSPGLGVEYHAH